jgi:hypothetical protein
VIAKEVAMPKAGGSFRGLVTYLTSSHGKTERLGRVRLTNCVSSDVASAVLEIESAQARNSRARHRTYHLILAFPAGEEPRADLLEAIERNACAALGFAEHQRVSVVHHDTDHLHVHVAINRVHPRTHWVHSPSYSKLVLDRLCVELEQEHGLQPTPHRTRERAAHLEAASALRESLQGSCAEHLRQARTWAELHEIAGRHGVQMQLRGNGLAFVGQDGSSGRASSVARDLSKAALERRLGAFEVSGQVPHAPDRQHTERQPRRAPDSERLGGVESLIGWIQRDCAQSLRGARSWSEVHAAAAARGLHLRLRGNGLVFVTQDGLAAKASSVARDLSKGTLEQRLGAFEPAGTTVQPVRAGYRLRPMARDERASRLYERYRQEREAFVEEQARAIAQIRQQRGRDEERLKRISQRRWAAVRLVAKGRVAWALWRAYAKQADRRDRERARGRCRATARAAAAQHPKPGWLEWLRSKAGDGDAEALAMLRRRSLREHPTPLRAVWSHGVPVQKVGGGVDSVTATGTVVYAVAGGSIRDDGRRLRLSGPGVSDTAAEALLRIANARYGARLGLDGDESFRARIVRVAAATALPITFADLQLEQRRLELLNQNEEHADGQRRAREPRYGAGSTRATGRSGGRVAGPNGVRESYGGWPRAGTTPQALADLRKLSALPVVRFGPAPAVLLPADARRDVEQRRAEQPDRGVRRDPAQRRIEGAPRRQGGRRRG